MMRTARTGVVVLNYGESSDTFGCLDSLEQSADLDLDIVVVDNAPASDLHDELRAGVGRRAEVIATGDNLGYAGGNNVGIRRLMERGVEYLWLLNPDTRVEPIDPDAAAAGHGPASGVRRGRARAWCCPTRRPTVWFDGGDRRPGPVGRHPAPRPGSAGGGRAPAPGPDHRLRDRSRSADPGQDRRAGRAPPGALLPVLRGDRLVRPRASTRLDVHGAVACADDAPQAFRDRCPGAVPRLLHDPEPLLLRPRLPGSRPRARVHRPRRSAAAPLASPRHPGRARLAAGVRRAGGACEVRRAGRP